MKFTQIWSSWDLTGGLSPLVHKMQAPAALKFPYETTVSLRRTNCPVDGALQRLANLKRNSTLLIIISDAHDRIFLFASAIASSPLYTGIINPAMNRKLCDEMYQRKNKTLNLMTSDLFQGNLTFLSETCWDNSYSSGLRIWHGLGIEAPAVNHINWNTFVRQIYRYCNFIINEILHTQLFQQLHGKLWFSRDAMQILKKLTKQ